MSDVPPRLRRHAARAEKHYRSVPMVRELCVVPIQDPGGDGAHLCAAVVPDMRALAARNVVCTRERIRWELDLIGVRLPRSLRLGEAFFFKEGLPRDAGGGLARAQIALQVRQMRQAAAGASGPPGPRPSGDLPEHPAARRFLARLEQVTGIPGPYTPDQDLQIDLGIDSLAHVQLAAILEEEFGVDGSDSLCAPGTTIGSLLRCVVARNGRAPTATRRVSLPALLTSPPATSLDELFNLNRGPLRRAFVRAAAALAARLARLVFSVRLEGADKLRRSGAFLLCPNHQSYIDSLLIYTLLSGDLIERTMFVADSEYFGQPPLSWLVRLCRVIPTGDVTSLADSLKLSYDALRRGWVVCIFPEGGRSLDGALSRARLGAAILACEAHVPLVPIRIEGAFRTLSPRHPRLRRCSIRLVVGDPIEPAKTASPQAYEAVLDRWVQAIQRMG